MISKWIHDHLKWPGEYASFFTGKKMVNILLILAGIIANDRVGLASPSLPIGKNSDISPSQELADWLFEQIENIFLRRVIRQNIVKLHVSVVSRPFYLECVVVL